MLPLIPISLYKLARDPAQAQQYLHEILPDRFAGAQRYSPVSQHEDPASVASSVDDAAPPTGLLTPTKTAKLSFRETARLSLSFCFLWFFANYLTAACLAYTTVASATLLTSTSAVFTLLFACAMRIERFTLGKLAGTLACLLGVALASRADWTGGGGTDGPSRGRFPQKSPAEVATGDAMALLSAACYGMYATLIKRRVGDESRVDIPLFFGLVGAWNAALLWPGLVVLHFLGVERFAPPPTSRVTAIVLANAAISTVSDLTWALSMLLTSPLLVTVGLSLTVPLSLVGQIVLDAQYVTASYWAGAAVVVGSFALVNYEENREEAEKRRQAERVAAAAAEPPAVVVTAAG